MMYCIGCDLAPSLKFGEGTALCDFYENIINNKKKKILIGYNFYGFKSKKVKMELIWYDFVVLSLNRPIDSKLLN